MAEVEGRGPRGRGIGDYRVVITSPREVIRLSIKCGIELGCFVDGWSFLSIFKNSWKPSSLSFASWYCLQEGGWLSRC